MARFNEMATFMALWLGGFIPRIKKDEEGQGLAEYALILVFIAIVCIAALILLGRNTSQVLSNVAVNVTGS